MIVRCVTNMLSDASDGISKYALTQDDNGLLDLSVGKHYPVYGIQSNEGMEWYLIHTDTEHTESFWWMPSLFFVVYDSIEPTKWLILDEGTKLRSYSSLSDWEVYEGIEDGDARAIERFNSEIDADPTFPSSGFISGLNSDYNKYVAMQRQKDLDLRAKERGWDNIGVE